MLCHRVHERHHAEVNYLQDTVYTAGAEYNVPRKGQN